MIPLTDCGGGEEIFEWVLDGRHRFFNVTRLRDYVQGNPVAKRITAGIDPSQVAFIVKNRGIEAWKLARLCEPWLSQPILALLMSDGTSLIVDGHHRIVRLYADGKETVEALLVPYDIGERFLIDVPPGGGIVA